MGLNFFEKLTDKQLLAVYNQAQQMEQKQKENHLMMNHLLHLHLK